MTGKIKAVATAPLNKESLHMGGHIFLGINVEGPIAPDTVFLKGYQGQYDIVIAMYHDQGHISMKLLVFNSGVNITVGFPIIRTSVDHGTAFGKASKGTADEESMIQAIISASYFN